VRLREVLIKALPERAVLQRPLKMILRSRLPKTLFKSRHVYAIALDITQIPQFCR
jgi:hypothetical protein